MTCPACLKVWVGGGRFAVGQREPEVPLGRLRAAQQLLSVLLEEVPDDVGLVALHGMHQQASQDGHLQAGSRWSIPKLGHTEAYKSVW